MPRHHQRVTNAHRAAVCGLVLAGLSFGESCRIAGVPYRLLHGLLGADWWSLRGPPPGRGLRWRGERLDLLKQAYGDRARSIASVALEFETTPDVVYALAKRHGWPYRRQPRPVLPVPLEEMEPSVRRQYLKVRRHLGRDAALRSVFWPAARAAGAD